LIPSRSIEYRVWQPKPDITVMFIHGSAAQFATRHARIFSGLGIETDETPAHAAFRAVRRMSGRLPGWHDILRV
jgi:hypothetical protein